MIKFYLKVLKTVFYSNKKIGLPIEFLAVLFAIQPLLIILFFFVWINDNFFKIEVNTIHMIVYTILCYFVHSVIRIIIDKHAEIAKKNISCVFSITKGFIFLGLIVFVYNVPIITFISFYLTFYA